MESLNKAGVLESCDDHIEVENDYRVKKIGKYFISHLHFLVGYGATSVVYKAYYKGKDVNNNKKKEKVVAIKKIKNLFENEVYAHRILRELRLLRLLKGHSNVSFY